MQRTSRLTARLFASRIVNTGGTADTMINLSESVFDIQPSLRDCDQNPEYPSIDRRKEDLETSK